MTESQILVSTWIPQSTFEELTARAKAFDTDLTAVLAHELIKAARERPKRLRNPMTADRLIRLKDLLASDLTINDVAAELGVSRSCVNNNLNRARAKEPFE